ncbi:nucleophile aminohydrolase [Aspergillus pseudonomiae]|uniref:Nucleophile aminohydrolase n=2 Tax=Aspergillus subgen. Circumdati TaxID=2720871 RepID=A0A5N7D1S0_9EURO|nr:nucleophile aminohydrolase [Aspergillus pseudonomiae]KAE8400057.1 nucleophile aminohydrolase [Aspergillus pseudonomiae]
MLGLGAYESSSEDETAKKAPSATKCINKGQPVQTATSREPSGPIVGPSHEEAQPEPHFSERSRLSNSRTLIHDLTLPPVPNLDIPLSPPGSPNSNVNAKFAHFLSLKKQGVHFNEKLAFSASLKNPSLLKKMMEHAGIDDQMQYFTSLPPEVWNVSGLPRWGFKEELFKSQKKFHQKAEEQWSADQRETIEFVAATTTDSDDHNFPPFTMNHYPEVWGRPRDDIYGPYNSSYLQTTGPKTHTQSPAVTGTSVLAVKFNGGVAIAADNLASYGSLARFTDVKRLRAFGDSAVVGFSGDVSDMQYIDRLLESIDIRENYSTHGNMLNAKNLHTYLSKVLYKRRSEFNPLWNHILVAGFDEDKKPFLSSADLLGTTYSAPHLATGFGAHLAIPILRRLFPEEKPLEEISKGEAEAALRECLKVLWYRDARSLDKYSIAVITAEGIEIKEDQVIEAQSWAFAESIRGYGAQVN